MKELKRTDITRMADYMIDKLKNHKAAFDFKIHS